MATIFTTAPDSPYDVELEGVGMLGGSARGGIPAERAALRLRELQNDDGEPLTGNALRKAAEDFAKARGLATATVKDVDEDALRVESGAFPKGLSVREVSEQASGRDAAVWEAHEAAGDVAPVLSAPEVPVPVTATQPPLPASKED